LVWAPETTREPKPIKATLMSLKAPVGTAAGKLAALDTILMLELAGALEDATEDEDALVLVEGTGVLEDEGLELVLVLVVVGSGVQVVVGVDLVVLMTMGCQVVVGVHTGALEVVVGAGAGSPSPTKDQEP